jgi:hypothetical protein
MTTRPDELEVANRRLQLRRWIDAFFNGSQVAFIASTNDGLTQLNSGELSLLLKKKSFGQKRARSLETTAHMPIGYLDSTARPGEPVVRNLQPRTAGGIASEISGRKKTAKWPFEEIAFEKISRLDSKTLLRLEGAILGIASQLKIDISTKTEGGASSPSHEQVEARNTA